MMLFYPDKFVKINKSFIYILNLNNTLENIYKNPAIFLLKTLLVLIDLNLASTRDIGVSKFQFKI